MTVQTPAEIPIHFTDHFGISEAALTEYGAFNISLLTDLPLFIDPFLLFNSSDAKYQGLHQGIIRYLRFLRDLSQPGGIDPGLLAAWFTFPEVRQNWLGYSKKGNRGSGLGPQFAASLYRNLNTVFSSFGEEDITRGSHLEKLCLIEDGVGRDNISDFTTNLIKGYLLRYSETFATNVLSADHRREFHVSKVQFNYSTRSWESGRFVLPWDRVSNDYVLLTPRNLLTKDDVWLGKQGLFHDLSDIIDGLPNPTLRAQVNEYFVRVLPEDASAKQEEEAKARVLGKFPVLIEYFIREREDRGDEARAVSDNKVQLTEEVFVHQAKQLARLLQLHSAFYSIDGNTFDEALERVEYLKDIIENKGGHRIFYLRGKPIRKEEDLQILYRLTWWGTQSDVTREANDGRGPADFKVSRGSTDKTIVEFKLATNPKLSHNLKRQAETYAKASDAGSVLKVILYFSASERERVDRILGELGLVNSRHIVLIDARDDNKPSGSRA